MKKYITYFSAPECNGGHPAPFFDSFDNLEDAKMYCEGLLSRSLDGETPRDGFPTWIQNRRDENTFKLGTLCYHTTRMEF